MVGMFKICDFCGAREEKEFERWGTIVMDGASVKNGHSTMDLCENCMNEVVENYRKFYVEKRTGIIQTLPIPSDLKEERVGTNTKKTTKTTRRKRSPSESTKKTL